MAQTQSRKKKILGDVKKARRRRALLSTLIVAIIAVGVVAAIIFLTPKPSPPDPHNGMIISAATNSQLTGVTTASLSAVGSGTGVTPLANVNGSPLKVGGKNEFLYVGAEYCPYCAAERWGIIVALSKFGNFTGLKYMQSSSTDAFPNTATFSFVSASYQSSWNITFVSVEIQDRDHNTLQTMTSQEQSLVNQYDSGGAIPFIDIAGTYLIQPASGTNAYAGAQFSPGILTQGGSTLNWTQIGSLLNTPSSGVAQAVDGTANSIIKAVCAVDNMNPSNLCSLTLAPPTQAPSMMGSQAPVSFNNVVSTIASSGQVRWRSFPRLI